MAQELSKEDIARMRQIHSDFVNQTEADPALAQDLLDATDWNMEAALQAYKGLSITYTEQCTLGEKVEPVIHSMCIYTELTVYYDDTCSSMSALVHVCSSMGVVFRKNPLKVGEACWLVLCIRCCVPICLGVCMN